MNEDFRAAKDLIDKLLADPEAFSRDGLANDLLNYFGHGYPIDKLALLMRHENQSVARAGIWIASELPKAAAVLLEDAVVLSHHPDRYVRHYAMDVIILGASGANRKQFFNVVLGLDDLDDVVADHSLFLVSRASEEQLAGAVEYFESEKPTSAHLSLLMAALQKPLTNPAEVESLLKSEDPLRRKYGLVLAERSYKDYPHLVSIAAASQDALISNLAQHMLKLHDIDKA